MFDEKAPPKLIRNQSWFAKTITTPLQMDSRLLDSHGASDYILPSQMLDSRERIEIYHQQYWWRLLKCLQENFPFLTRLFGHASFNEIIGVPYLSAHPPTHWGLNRLGMSLPAYLEKHYLEEDKDLVLAASHIDWSMQVAFWCEKKPLIDFSSAEILTLPMRLQPHVHLFRFPADLFTFRERFLEEEVEYWDTHPFPDLAGKESFFLLYRSPQNIVKWKELSKAEFQLLGLFRVGCSIQEACEKMESGEHAREAEEYLSLWFHEWTALGLFSEEY
jgi:hypothetical protein